MKIHLDELEKGLGRVQIETMASRMDDYEDGSQVMHTEHSTLESDKK